jgi:hypothetical protein
MLLFNEPLVLAMLLKREVAAVCTAGVVLATLLVSRGGAGARFGSEDAVSEVV